MKAVAAQFPGDDTIQTLFAEAAMDTQPWDYWEAGGAKPKGRAADIVARARDGAGAQPDASRRDPPVHPCGRGIDDSPSGRCRMPGGSAALMPGAGHVVHMPAHIYYRVGMYRESLEANKRAIAVDERYFATSPSDPLYKSAYYPHNIHFLMVSAQMGGDGKTAVDAATKLDAAVPVEVVKQFAILEPIKAAPYTTHAQFADSGRGARAARAGRRPGAGQGDAPLRARRRLRGEEGRCRRAARDRRASRTIEASADFKPFEPWGVPGQGDRADRAAWSPPAGWPMPNGNLDAAAKAYEDAIAIEDALAYTEPPYWYYPVRQSLGAVRLRQGRLDEAEQAFRDSLGRVRNNGWALAGLAEVYRKKGDAKAE